MSLNIEVYKCRILFYFLDIIIETLNFQSKKTYKLRNDKV